MTKIGVQHDDKKLFWAEISSLLILDFIATLGLTLWAKYLYDELFLWQFEEDLYSRVYVYYLCQFPSAMLISGGAYVFMSIPNSKLGTSLYLNLSKSGFEIELPVHT